MRNLALSVLVLMSSTHVYALDSSDLSVGVGAFSAENSDCNKCDYIGQTVEVGYNYTNVLAFDAKYAVGDSAENTDIAMAYVGVNIGHDFGSNDYKLYAKGGLGNVTENDYSETGFTLGFGGIYAISKDYEGLFIKFESLALKFQDESVGMATSLGLNYLL